MGLAFPGLSRNRRFHRRPDTNPWYLSYPAQLTESVSQSRVIGPLAECVDVERLLPSRTLSPQSSQAWVFDAPGSEQVAVWAWYELQSVAWAYVHRVEDVGWESDLAL